MPNRLSNETSPYLRQHSENPVDWYPWGKEALIKAQELQRPIFLSIGYAACHWCHVMAHESFEDPEIAQYMNDHFINIKVDREERPDLDSIYMNAVVAMTRQGGWPLSAFLTPEGKPFFGGTYFPPIAGHGLPSFLEVLNSVDQAWKKDRTKIDQFGSKLVEHIEKDATWMTSGRKLTPSILDHAKQALLQTYDWKHGGWGEAPKFPQPMALEFLLRLAARGDQTALEAAIHALQEMSTGGMRDLIGGGFHRYSTDAVWLVPHFEKMLYDNAQLASVYLHAFLITGDTRWKDVCTETLNFLLREMTHPSGGFFSSLDADTEGAEGRFYTWSLDDLEITLTDPLDREAFFLSHEIIPGGNFEGRIILRRSSSNDEVAEKLNITHNEFVTRLSSVYHRLMELRGGRVRPGTDDKVLVSWNALALRAFAEAGRFLKEPDFLQAACRNAEFILTYMVSDGSLHRSWRDGQVRQLAFLEDYAGLVVALLTLYQADPDPRWFETASQLIVDMNDKFLDEKGGFFDAQKNEINLIVRTKDYQDNAIPSGNALSAHGLLLVSEFTGEVQFRLQAEEILAAIQESAVRYPTAFGYWLNVLDFATHPVYQLAIIGDHGSPDFEDLGAVAFEMYRPQMVIACSSYPPSSNSAPLLHNRIMIEGRASAYLCQDFTCRLPVTEPAALRAQLDNPIGPD